MYRYYSETSLRQTLITYFTSLHNLNLKYSIKFNSFTQNSWQFKVISLIPWDNNVLLYFVLPTDTHCYLFNGFHNYKYFYNVIHIQGSHTLEMFMSAKPTSHVSSRHGPLVNVCFLYYPTLYCTRGQQLHLS